jgi:glycosyltransferase involved in cell wall biosynthesis
LIHSGCNGFCSDSLPELRRQVEYLLTHPEEAKQIGTEGRKTAISLFGKESIKKQWQDFLSTL